MNPSYFDRVYESTYHSLLKYAIVHLSDPTDAEDALQNVYIRFYRRVERYGRLDILSPKAFLRKMLKREIIRHYAKREKQRLLVVSDPEADRIADEDDFEDGMIDRVLVKDVFAAAKALPAETYRTFVLFYGFELTIPEIAETLDVTKEAVKTRLYRARSALKARMQTNDKSDKAYENGDA